MTSVAALAGTDAVLAAVARRWGVSVARMLDGGRTPQCARARHVAMLVLRMGGVSYPRIARAVGLRDHTTAMYGCRRAQEDPDAMVAVMDVVRTLGIGEKGRL